MIARRSTMLREFRRNFSFSGEQINRVKYSAKKSRLFSWNQRLFPINILTQVLFIQYFVVNILNKMKVQLENTIQGYSKSTQAKYVISIATFYAIFTKCKIDHRNMVQGFKNQYTLKMEILRH